MARDPKIMAPVLEPKVSRHDGVPPEMSKVRTMSLDKAKKLIRKTSAEHSELFRRLAK